MNQRPETGKDTEFDLISSLGQALEMASGSKSDDETSRLVSSVNECTRA